MRHFLLGWVPALAYTALTYYLSSRSNPPGAELGPDYILHFFEYALFALLWWRAFRTLAPLATRAVGLAFLATFFYAAFDEWHQSWVPGRDPSPFDWAVDCVAAAIALLTLRFWRKA